MAGRFVGRHGYRDPAIFIKTIIAGSINYYFPFDPVKMMIITMPANGARQSWQPTGRKKTGRPLAARCLLEYARLAGRDAFGSQ